MTHYYHKTFVARTPTSSLEINLRACVERLWERPGHVISRKSNVVDEGSPFFIDDLVGAVVLVDVMFAVVGVLPVTATTHV